MQFLSGVVVLALVLGAKAQAEEGSGVVREEARAVGPFGRVHVQQGLSAEVTLGSTPSVVVRGDDNLIKRVETVVEGGQLFIRVAQLGSYSTRKGLHVKVVATALAGADAEGGASLTLTHIRGDTLKLRASGGASVEAIGLAESQVRADVSGGGSAELSGQVRELKLECSGGGSFNGKELVVDKVEVDVSGGGSAELTAAASVRGEVSSGGALEVHGGPAVRQVASSSGGAVSYE